MRVITSFHMSLSLFGWLFTSQIFIKVMLRKFRFYFSILFSGKHYIDVYWNKYPLDNSPFIGYAVPRRDEPDRFDPVVVHVSQQAPPKEKRKKPSNRISEPPGGYWVRADRKPHYTDNGPQKLYILSPGRSEPSLDDVSFSPCFQLGIDKKKLRRFLYKRSIYGTRFTYG